MEYQKLLTFVRPSDKEIAQRWEKDFIQFLL